MNTTPETNKKAPKNTNMTKFLCLIIGAIVLVAAVTVAVFLISGGNSNTNSEYEPKDYYGEPAGGDEEHTNRY